MQNLRDESLLRFCSTNLLIALLFLLSSNLSAADTPCEACHSQTAQAHTNTPHGKSALACTSCHGDSAAHTSSPSTTNIRTFAGDGVADQLKICSDCHNESHGAKPNAHDAAGINCGSCHLIHTEKQTDIERSQLPIEYEKLTSGSTVCFDCHEDTFAQFEFNERHRLAEGVVACTSCHDPHSPGLVAELGGFQQAVCAECHADVEGPFVFEHAASRVDGCASCHESHGSPNRHMLKIQDVGALCYSCHADVPQFHLGFSPTAPPRFDESTVCTNCHVAIHGSNLDRLFLR